MLRHRDDSGVDALFRAVFESTLDAILIADDDRRYVEANEAACALLGRTREELIGLRVDEVGPTNDGVDETWRRFIQLGALRGEFEITRPDGTHRTVDYSARANIAPGRHLTMMRDVTARKRSDDAVRKQNERLRLLSDAAGGLIESPDPDVIVRALFEEVAQHLGLDVCFNYMVDEADSALRLDSYTGVSAATAAGITRREFGQAVCGAVAADRRAIVVTDVQASDDPRVALVKRLGIRAYACTPLLAGGRLLGTLSFGTRTRDRFEPDEIALMRTIAHYVALAKDRVRAEHALKEADRRKDDFLATLSHELRSPMSAVLTWSRLLRSGALDEEKTRRALETIERSVRLQVRLIEDLLDISRIVSGKLSVETTRVDLRAVVEAAVEVTRPGAETKRIRMDVELEPGPVPVRGDAARLQQVAGNLISNAVKFTPEGGRVAVTLARDGAHAALVVQDTGIGIPGHLLSKIFDRFRQADRSITRRYGGLGLGLALARHLVDLHGGRIEAASAGEDQGARFRVCLPLDASASHAVPPPPRTALPWLHGIRVLVLDDEANVRDFLSTLLAGRGAEVCEVETVEEALGAVAARPPDVIVTDIAMPDQDGYALVTRVRAAERGGASRVPIIALTALAGPEHAERALAAGFDLYLTKPVEPTEVLSAIARLR
jgi:PAS domain S-box-containing protein